jgi:hypothetical protein
MLFDHCMLSSFDYSVIFTLLDMMLFLNIRKIYLIIKLYYNLL